MATDPVVRARIREAPFCEDSVVHLETVARLRPEIAHLEGVAGVFKALADDTRVKVVHALAHAELCVCDVAAILGSSKATASYHLRLLHHLGLAKYRREGKLVYYRLSDPHLGHMIEEVLRHRESSENKRNAPSSSSTRSGYDGGDD